MQQIKLMMFPSFVGELIEGGKLHPTDLTNPDKLTAILSERSVNKILYLNSGGYHDKDSSAIDMFKLDIFNSYVRRSGFTGLLETNTPYYTAGPTLNALCKMGDEEMVSVLSKTLHNYHLPFKAVRIKPKTYAIIFQSLCEVNSPLERLDKYSKDMEGLVSSVSLELSSAELLNEDLYQHYLSLF